MSTQNDLINYQNVIKEANSLINEQIKLWGGVVSSIQQVGKVTPSSFVNAQKQVNETLQKSIELETKLEAVEKKRQATVQQVLNTGSSIAKQKEKENALTEKMIANEEKANAKRIALRNKEVQNVLNTGASIERQKQKELAAEQKAQALLERSENVYNKVQQKVNQLTATYNNLATRKELGRKLTDQELAQLNSLEGRLNRYNEVLKKVDAQIGNNRRNVGNYASGWNGLGNSINQITRELPAFTFSAQTGFLALSNNIPILADEIQRVSANVKELRAQGQQVPSVMSQILTSFLSWQTALSIGVTLITVYGKEIGNFFTEMFKGSKIVDSTTKLLETYNKTLKDGDYEKVYKDVSGVAIAFDQARKGVITKKEALRTYNEVLGKVMGKTEDFTKAEATFNAQARNYVEATLAKAQANILLSESATLAAENIEIQNRKEQGYGERLMATLQTGGIFGQLFSSSKDLAGDKVLENRNKLIETNTNQINANKKAAEELVKKFQGLSANLNIGTLFTDEEKDTKTKKDKTPEDRLKAEYEAQKTLLEQQKSSLRIQDEILATEIQLATLERDYKKKLVDLQVKDKKTSNNEKLAIENEYATAVNKINKELSENYGDDFDAELAKVTESFKSTTEAAEQTEDAVNKLIARGKELGVIDLKIEGVDLKQNTKAYFDNQRAIIEAEYAKDEELYKEDLEKLTEAGKQRTLRLAQLKQDELQVLKDFNSNLKSILSDSFDSLGFGSLSLIYDEQVHAMWKMADEQDNVMAKMAVAVQVFGQIANDVFNAMSERQNAYYEQQFKNLETEKDLAIKFAGENTAGREAIERQYEEKKRALQMQQARQQKQMAMLQATINIAQGITSALAQAPPYSFILAALVGVLGAVQLAKISSTPLPQYATGRDGGVAEWAITQEKGSEMIVDKNNNIKTLGSSKGPALTYLNKGDTVFTADETTQKLNELLISSGVSPIVNVSGGSGMSKEDMREVLNDTLAKQPKNITTLDRMGLQLFQEENNKRKISKNRIVKIG